MKIPRFFFLLLISWASMLAQSPTFYDDFERSALTPYSQNGVAWGADNTKPGDYVEMSTDRAVSGTRSLKFHFAARPDDNTGASDNHAEQRLGFGQNVTEFSIVYSLYLPANFYHRNAQGSDNNKGVGQFWSGPYGAVNSNQYIGFEYWPSSGTPGSSNISLRAGQDGADLGHDHGGGETGSGSMFRLTERGKWIQFRVHVKLATGAGQTNGIIRAWKWVAGEPAPELIFDKTNWAYSTRGNYLDQSYILGWSNSGFAEATDFYVDNFGMMIGGLIDWNATGGGSAPAAPSSLSATGVSSSQINLAWADNASDETGFKVDRKTGSGGTYAQIATPGANATTHNNTGLTASTTYYYRVRATNANGDSAWSNEANATTSGAGSPEVNVTGNGVTIADGDTTPGTADHTDFGSADISGVTVTRTYTVQNTGSAALTVNTVTLSGSSDFAVTAQPASSIAAGGSTTFSVRFDPSASGLRSASVSFGNNDANENPYNFSIQGTGTDGGTSTTFVTGQTLSGSTWNDSTGYNGMKITVGATPLVVTELARWVVSGNSQAHTVKITRVSDSVDLGSVSVTTAGATPGQFKYAALGAPVTLSANTAYYIVSQETAGGDYWVGYGTVLAHSSVATVNQAYASASGLAGTTNNCYGPVSFKYTEETAVPAAPSGLTATVASASQIDLSWTDNASDETGFKIERKTGSGGTYSQIATVGANATSYNSTGLSASTTYYYRVRAYNGSGDSVYSNEANATTPAAIAFRAASSSEGSGQSATLNKPAGVVSGDLMLAAINLNSNVSITAPTGWTLVRTITDSMILKIYRKTAGASEPASYTWTLGGTRFVGGMVAFSGVNATTPIQVENGAAHTTTASTTHTTPSITTSGSATWLVSIFGDKTAGGSTWTPPSGATERVDVRNTGTSTDMSLEINTVGPVAAGSKTHSAVASVSSAQAGMAIIALQP